MHYSSFLSSYTIAVVVAGGLMESFNYSDNLPFNTRNLEGASLLMARSPTGGHRRGQRGSGRGPSNPGQTSGEAPGSIGSRGDGGPTTGAGRAASGRERQSEQRSQSPETRRGANAPTVRGGGDAAGQGNGHVRQVQGQTRVTEQRRPANYFPTRPDLNRPWINNPSLGNHIQTEMTGPGIVDNQVSGKGPRRSNSSRDESIVAAVGSLDRKVTTRVSHGPDSAALVKVSGSKVKAKLTGLNDDSRAWIQGQGPEGQSYTSVSGREIKRLRLPQRGGLPQAHALGGEKNELRVVTSGAVAGRIQAGSDSSSSDSE